MNPYRDALGRWASKQTAVKEFASGYREAFTRPSSNLSKKGTKARKWGRRAAKATGLAAGIGLGVYIGKKRADKQFREDILNTLAGLQGQKEKRRKQLEGTFWYTVD